MRLLLAGDSQALAVAAALRPGEGVTAQDDLVRTTGRVGSRIEEWAPRLDDALTRARTDVVLLFLGSANAFDAFLPSLEPILATCARRAVTLVWIGPPKVRGQVPTILDGMKSVLSGRCVFVDSCALSFEQASDGITPTEVGARALAKAAYAAIPPVATETADLSDAFFTSGAALGERLHLSFLHLLFVMNLESAGIRSNADNGAGAVGLIQLQNLAAVGFTGTRQDFKNLSAEEQLPYVEKYLEPYAPLHLDSAARVWQAVLAPATLTDPSEVIYARRGVRWNGQEKVFYRGNAWIDRAGKGEITVEDLDRELRKAATTARFSQAARRYSLLTGVGLPTAEAYANAMTPVRMDEWASVATIAVGIVGVWYAFQDHTPRRAAA